MKIYLYLKDFRPTQKPEMGMEKAVAGLAGGFVANGIDTTVLCESDADHTATDPAGFKICCFRNSGKRTQLHLAEGLQSYAAKEFGPDSLVILNAVFHPSVARFARLLRKLHVPYIVAPHDPYHPSIYLKNAHLKWPYWYIIERPMLRRALAVQVLDRRHGDLLRARGVQTPSVEVVNGHSPDEVLPVEELQFRSAGPPRLLYLGRMETLNKGLDLLLEAFNEVAETSNATLTLQGPDSGDLAGLKEQAAALTHGDRIQFLSPDFTTSSSSLANAFDVYILPSRFEGFSLATMEAMLAARPVVITNIAGLAPHVRACGGGIIVKSTAPAIRDGLLAMLARRGEWQSMGMAGRDYVLTNLRWDRIAAKALDAYRKLLAPSPEAATTAAASPSPNQ